MRFRDDDYLQAHLHSSDIPDLPSILDNLYLLIEVWQRDKHFLGWAEVQMAQVRIPSRFSSEFWISLSFCFLFTANITRY